MKHSEPNTRPPSRDGVGASCVALSSMHAQNPVNPESTCVLLLDFLAQRMPHIPREVWHQRMARGDVVDGQGQGLPPDYPYRPAGHVYYFRELAAETPIPFEAQILLEDDHLVVVDKPHFLPVMPSGKYLQETVLVRLKRQLKLDTLVPVHRIDRDTAGLVIFSKQPQSRGLYCALFRERQVQKIYQAIAPWRADLELPKTLQSRIVPAQHFMLQQEVAGPPNALTHLEVLEVRGNQACYQLIPLTGKRHQLRVHMASLGLPILGDGLYPTLTPEGQIDHAQPLQLLAQCLSFTDPVTHEPRRLTSRRQLAWTVHG